MFKEENLLSFFPLAAGALTFLSIIFNVGFFYRIGIGFYTLFSIQDHIIFAFQIMPLVTMITMMVIVLFFAALVYIPEFNISRLYDVTIRNVYLLSVAFVLLVVSYIFLSTSIFSAFDNAVKNYIDKRTLTVLSTLLMIIVSMVLVLIISRVNLLRADKNRTNVLVYLIILLIGHSIFSFGYFYGTMSTSMKEDRFIYKILPNESDMYVILRSGGSGVLLMRRNGDVIFIKNERIYQIEKINT